MLSELLGKKVVTSSHQPLPQVVIMLGFVILITYWLVDTWGCYGSCVSIGSGLLFSILMLYRVMDIAYCMVMTLIFSNVYIGCLA